MGPAEPPPDGPHDGWGAHRPHLWHSALYHARLLLPFSADDSLPSHSAVKLVTGGMAGGHSGIDVIEGRANAIKELFRGIHLIGKKTDVRISTLSGGSARNAIPRDAEAILLVPSSDVDMAIATVVDLGLKLKSRTKQETAQQKTEKMDFTMFE